MGYAKYTEDDNEIRIERYQSFDYKPYYSEYYFPHPPQKKKTTEDYFSHTEKHFYKTKED